MATKLKATVGQIAPGIPARWGMPLGAFGAKVRGIDNR